MKHEFQLQRYSDDQESTLGLLHQVMKDNYPFFWGYTLEDEFRAKKVKGETRIPAGRYEIKILKELTPLTKTYRARYPWFKYHLEITGVEGFTGIYMHIGNNDKNTDGCILLASSANNNQFGDGRVLESTEAFKRFYERFYPDLDNGMQAFINVRDEEGILL